MIAGVRGLRINSMLVVYFFRGSFSLVIFPAFVWLVVHFVLLGDTNTKYPADLESIVYRYGMERVGRLYWQEIESSQRMLVRILIVNIVPVPSVGLMQIYAIAR